MILFGVLFEVGVLIYMFSLVILLKYLIIAFNTEDTELSELV